MEIDRIIRQAEHHVRHGLRSRASRDAQKRRMQRKVAEFFRRVRRSAWIFAGLMAAMVAWSIFIDPIGFLTWLVAIPTAMLIAFLSLFWPSRQARIASQAPGSHEGAHMVPLAELASRVEDGLIDRSKQFPGRALPAADRVIERLAELQPHLAGLDNGSMLAGDARRLIGTHLPRLVDTYLDLPPSAREPTSEASERFTESLATVGSELDHLLDQCCRDRHLSFETQRRFIETRYSEDPGLSGGRGE